MEKEYSQVRSNHLKNFLVFSFFILSPFGLFLLALTELFEGIHKTNYIEIIDQSLVFSLFITLISTGFSLFIGSMLSFKLEITKQKHTWIKKLFQLVVLFPHIAFAYITYLFFAPEGFLNRLTPIELNLVNDYLGLGIIINYIIKEVPFICLLLISSKSHKQDQLLQTSSSLGASKWETYLKVYLPLNISSLSSAAIILFAFILGNYEVPSMLGSNSLQFSSVQALELFQSIDDIDNNKSRGVILTLFSLSLIFAIFIKSVFKLKSQREHG